MFAPQRALGKVSRQGGPQSGEIPHYPESRSCPRQFDSTTLDPHSPSSRFEYTQEQNDSKTKCHVQFFLVTATGSTAFVLELKFQGGLRVPLHGLEFAPLLLAHKLGSHKQPNTG
jgi:hypothetical protein